MGTNDLTIMTHFFTRNAVFRLTIAMVKPCPMPTSKRPPEMLLEDFCPEAAIDEVHHPQDVTCQRDPSGEDHMLRVDAFLKAIGDSMPQNRTQIRQILRCVLSKGKAMGYIYIYVCTKYRCTSRCI